MEKPKKLEKYPPEWYDKMREAGRAGGLANLANNGPEHFSRIGARGGKSLMKKHGREHFSRIGSIKKRKEDQDV